MMEHKKLIHINIGRQIGAGGLELAHVLGQRLSIKVYDKELITLAAKESGFDSSLFAKADEKDTLSLNSGFSFLSFVNAVSSVFGSNVIGGEKLFEIQSNVIKRLADEQSTIFVGRCADYILRDYPNCLNVFVSADIKDRIARVRSQGSSKFKDLDTIDDTRLEELLNKGDRRRASYYGEYSLKTWGAAESYHLCLNSSLFGIEGCAEIIEKFITERFF